MRRRPAPQSVVLTGSLDSDDAARAKEAGATGYVTKDRILAELVTAIRSAVG